MTGDNTPQADASPAIDYDKLASAILRQTSQGPPSSTEPQHDQNFKKLRETVNVPWQNSIQEIRLEAASTKYQFQNPQQNQPGLAYYNLFPIQNRRTLKPKPLPL